MALVPYDISLSVAAAYSDPEDALNTFDGIDHVVEAPNAPLSAKWERALQLARGLLPDALVIMGSDDWIDARALRLLILRGLSDGYAGTRVLYVHDLASAVTVRLDGYAGERSVEPIGAGRVLSREVMDRLDWSLWPQVQINRALDAHAHRRILSVGRPRAWHGPIVAPILDVKDPVTQLTAWRSFSTLPRVDANELDQALGCGTAGELTALRSRILQHGEGPMGAYRRQVAR